MSIYSQIGTYVGNVMKTEADAEAADKALKTATADGNITDLGDNKDSSLGTLAEENQPEYEADADAKKAALDAEIAAAKSYLESNVDAGAIDSLSELRSEIETADTARDNSIVDYFTSGSANVSTHVAEAGTYAEYLAAFEAEGEEDEEEEE